jgi:hypothetical protein
VPRDGPILIRGPFTSRNAIRRLQHRNQGAFKTTEFFAFVAVLIGILIAGAVVDSSDAGGYGARQVWSTPPSSSSAT